MKKRLTIVLTLALLCVFSTSFAQKKNAFKVNIFSPILRTGSFFFERSLGAGKSAQLGFFYTGIKISDTKISGFGITPEFRLYPSKNESLKGFYVAPFLRYQSFTLTVPSFDEDMNPIEGKANLSTFGGGVLIGGQFLFGDLVVLDIFIGPAYNSGSVKIDAGQEDDFSTGSLDGFGIRTGVCLGITF